jgi:hypothetical protein
MTHNKSKKINGNEQLRNMILENGYSYLLKDISDDPGAQLLLKKEMLGGNILRITRSAPKDNTNKEDASESSTIWLTFNKGPNCIEPTNITRLSIRIQKFLKENKEGTILMDGLEYLSSQNDFSTILHFIQLVNDKIMISDSKLILSLDPSAFKEKELALIEREMESLNGKVSITTDSK